MLTYLNIAYITLAVFFLSIEKIETGNFVPHVSLAYVYLFVGAANFFSALYNYWILSGKTKITLAGQQVDLDPESKFDIAARWVSIISIMFLAFLNMIGFENPSNDSILVDFAFGHSLIVLAAILLGRKAAFVWFLIVLGTLLLKSYSIGFTYQYNYLTRAESARYEKALEQNENWAIRRKTTLQQEGLNPPKVVRYLNEWIVFILIAFFTAYFFTGISLDMIKIIPSVTQRLANAIDTVKEQELEREREKNLQEEQKMRLEQETLHAELNFLKSQLNPHFLYNTLYYLYVRSREYSDDLADSLLKVSDIMRYSLREDSKFVLVQEEITYLKDFIALHQMRNKNKLQIVFNVQGPTDQKFIIPFILISLVENAFKHGRMTNRDFPVIINLTCYEDRIDFYMRNQKGHKPTVDSTHVGLANIQRRLDLTYPSSYTFKIEQDQDSFSCWLSILA
ncbi:histidine kinase internal region [Spirosoma telluris]|uniref:Histidine kinase internal region n=1 Tax=Spirosoma telluris TaxID=2183553 RepID=A0A327NFV4_9BACT|nr:histidine kinase internal region [Spirosoma telluris]